MKNPEIISLLREQYGLNPKLVRDLAGYENHNYQVETTDRKYVLKTYPWSEETEELIRAENELLMYLSERVGVGIPQPVRSAKGTYHHVESAEKVLCRMLTFLEGIFLGDITPNQETWSSLGSALARIDKVLKDYRSPVHSARRYYWDLNHPELSYDRVAAISDPGQRKYVDYFFLHFEQEVRPVIPHLRQQIIYGDANEWNILTNGRRVTGFIDFGDVVESPLINELAIAITYVMMGNDDPLTAAEEVLRSYHAHHPLTRDEIDLLYLLVGVRLSISVCSSAYSRQLDPDNEYLSVSEKPAWDLIQYWVSVNPRRITDHFRKACGFPALPRTDLTATLAKRNRYFSKGLSVSYRKPVHMERAAFQYMFDQEGNAYLDAYNNIPHVGHQHPAVVNAGMRQMRLLNTNTRYIYDQLTAYAEKLLSHFPEPLDKVFFVNSGSAASDLALRLARNYTGRRKVAVLEHGYHGNTSNGISISHYKYAGKGGPGKPEHTLELPLPDAYRGKYKGPEAGRKYAGDAVCMLAEEPDLATFIAEPIVGCGGQVPLADGYLPDVYKQVRKQGGLCISDEVQTGFGRMGHTFWGFELYEVTPDMVVLGKPMGNGHPMGAVVTTSAVAEAFDNGMEFFSSFGGNPVSCEIGMAVLDVIEKEQLRQNARDTGSNFMKLLNELGTQFPCIGDVRGSGLFIGVELIEDEKRTPATDLAGMLKNELRNRYILVSTDGPYDNVIKMKPPLCFSEANALRVVEEMKNILAEVRS